jgi:iron(III) transport system substrate-binding protein
VATTDWPASLLELTDAHWRGRVVMAKPWHGTSLTQAVCLFEVLGSEKARQYYQALKDNGLQVAPGNKQVAEWVGAGRTPVGQPAAIGITDTDDALAEVKAGRPVALVFPDGNRTRKDRMGTLFIPNTLAMMKGCPNPAGARRLIDYLLSPEVERKLAAGESHQIPINPKVESTLPPQLQTPKTVHAMQVDWYKAADCWDEADAFLHQQFAGP